MSYTCHLCKQDVTMPSNSPSEILWFEQHMVCPKCYMKLQGADLLEIKEILLRIEKKIENKE